MLHELTLDNVFAAIDHMVADTGDWFDWPVEDTA